MTAKELQTVICGEPELDVNALKSIASCSLRGGKDGDQWRFFWEAMESFNCKERAMFLGFAFARERLPRDLTGLRFKLSTDASLDADSFPTASTCFFSVNLPMFSSVDACRSRIKTAAELCGAIDTDFNIR